MNRKSKLLADILLDYIDKMQGEDLLEEEDDEKEEDLLEEPKKMKISVKAFKLPRLPLKAMKDIKPMKSKK
jgi:hypothetical protein